MNVKLHQREDPLMHRRGGWAGLGRTKTQEALKAAVPSVPSFWKNEFPLPPLPPPPVFFLN